MSLESPEGNCHGTPNKVWIMLVKKSRSRFSDPLDFFVFSTPAPENVSGEHKRAEGGGEHKRAGGGEHS